MLIHTVDKPHKCDACGKLFSDKSNLTKHILAHTGDKPHSCGVCGKLFTLKASLTRQINHTCVVLYTKKTNGHEIIQT